MVKCHIDRRVVASYLPVETFIHLYRRRMSYYYRQGFAPNSCKSHHVYFRSFPDVGAALICHGNVLLLLMQIQYFLHLFQITLYSPFSCSGCVIVPVHLKAFIVKHLQEMLSQIHSSLDENSSETISVFVIEELRAAQ